MWAMYKEEPNVWYIPSLIISSPLSNSASVLSPFFTQFLMYQRYCHYLPVLLMEQKGPFPSLPPPLAAEH